MGVPPKHVVGPKRGSRVGRFLSLLWLNSIIMRLLVAEKSRMNLAVFGIVRP